MQKDLVKSLLIKLLDSKKLPRDKKSLVSVSTILKDALDAKQGVPELVDSIAQSKTEYRNLAGYLVVAIRNLPDKLPTKSVEQEIEEETQDFKETEALLLALSAEWSKPNEPRFFAKPSIMECLPYCENPELWAENTYIEIRAEAERENTSMHEICRRKGLAYGALII